MTHTHTHTQHAVFSYSKTLELLELLLPVNEYLGCNTVVKLG